MMKFNEETLEALKSLALISKQQELLEKAVQDTGYQLDNHTVYDAAMYLYESVGMFIEALEEMDPNLDPHKNELPDIDTLFAGNPVTEYVDAVINVAVGTGKVEQVQEAAQKLADFQEEVYGEKKVGYGSLGEFVDYILNDLGVEGGSYAETFKRELEMAIEVLKKRPGYSKFILSSNTQSFEGTLKASDEEVNIEIGGKEYRFVANEGTECEGETCPYCTDCDCKAEEEDCEEMSLIDYIKEVDEVHAEEVNLALNEIEQHLDNKAEFDADDIQLIRYYLSNLPGNSKYDIEELNDKAVKLAYRQRQLVRNIR